ncbi:DUF6125 family protein [Desulfomonile tiedjei]|uniref:Uncharacterized protein n=1 Tax=Desulfomonile tiedjei (strain ATCC 49306 / DSM 6799 / DCB-1) TaxID=706587 RepID=I4C1D6_DESTA|nr:DUF6125 family protein [Desulfomonile tiedjei]AFM23377.1 hypothetical protein Desti_0651 [Desulfomonile tiedjei DSM 6799]
MKAFEEIGKSALRELLIKNWMTHDGTWFYHCLQTVGIEKTNELNKAAIKSLAGIEMGRIRKIFEFTKPRVDNLEELTDFIDAAFRLNIGDFMGATHSFPEKNLLRWEVGDQGCWAYRGVKRLGVIDRYECGVMYRIFCWLDCLGIQYRVSPNEIGCLFHKYGKCAGDIRLFS